MTLIAALLVVALVILLGVIIGAELFVRWLEARGKDGM